MGPVAAAAAIVVAEVGADDPLDVGVVADELVAKLWVVAVKLVAVEGPAVEGGEGVALGERVVEQWVVVRRVEGGRLPLAAALPELALTELACS